MNNEQREKFLELCLNGNKESAIDLARNNHPQYICKYCSFDAKEKNLENIKNNHVYLRPANKFNDPYDCKIFIDKNKILSHLKSTRYFEDNIYKCQNMIKVSCFSELNDNLLMWGHYSNKHQGFCIEYETKKLIDVLDNYEEESERNIAIGFLPVIYHTKKIDFTKQIAPSYKGELSLYLAGLVKFIQWEYEYEWRLIYSNKFSKSGQICPMPKPYAIYLGTKIDTKNRVEIAKIALEKDIPVYQMIFSDTDEYRLHPKQIKQKELKRLVTGKL